MHKLCLYDRENKQRQLMIVHSEQRVSKIMEIKVTDILHGGARDLNDKRQHLGSFLYENEPCPTQEPTVIDTSRVRLSGQLVHDR